MNKDYAVIAVKCENRFFGFWTRRGMTRSYDWMGNKSGDDDYESPSLAESRQYELTTVSANSVSCNKVAGSTGQMTLTFDGSSVAISSDDGKITGTGSFNGATLLQDREIYLRYKVTHDDGSYDEVRDTLAFRNRIRDGINEWQDENPDQYKK